MMEQNQGDCAGLQTVARGFFVGLIVLALVIVVTIIAAATLGIEHAHARDNGQWGNSPAEVRAWFQSLMQPDAPSVSCCGEADAFEADTFEVAGDHYVAIITDGKGVLPNGTRINVPNAKMKWDAGNPTGHGIIFIGGGGSLYCYVAPSGV
ncbi:MAG: hypothetical protein JWP25_8980 [Bradyrhizobium sp.]|nr:hypothetical protein [Bradyrhizobium sp.]